MRLRVWLLIGAATIALALIAGGAVGRAIWAPKEKPAAPMPALYIAEDKQDLGEVWESNDAVLTVPISNSTDLPIIIHDFKCSCNCGEISSRQLTIPAKGTSTIQIKLDLTPRGPNQLDLQKRKLKFSFGANAGDSKRPIDLVADCVVLSSIVTDRSSVHFGDMHRIRNAGEEQIIIVRWPSGMKMPEANAMGTGAENVSARVVSIDSGKAKVVLAIRPQAWEQKGDFRSEVVLRSR